MQHAKPIAGSWKAILAGLLSVLLLGLPVQAADARTGKTAATRPAAKMVAAKATRNLRAKATPRRTVRVAAPRRPSVGEVQGLRATDDPLELKSSVALVVDQETNQVLLSKNPQAVLPIASITKLMTAVVLADAQVDLHERITIVQDDVDTEMGSRSRLKVGTELTRGELLHLALMSSENRAAHALGRSFPGGLATFVERMNAKARELGMSDTRYVEPTGLSSDNRSSARDLTLLVKSAYQFPLLRELSTSPEAVFPVGSRQVQFRNTNGLVRNPDWDIGLQKTGYIAAAGRCLVMQAELAGRKLIMVLLDSAGKYSRIGDAERIRSWLNRSGPQESLIVR